jgi:predicted aldo/keto reductase-like oxidoreductase
MKSMTGGDRQDLGKWREAGLSLPQAKLKWVLQNPRVSTVITEMESFAMLAEDLAVCGAPLTDEEKEALDKFVRATSRDTCRMCGTCVRHCPAGIPISDIFRYLTYHEGHGKTRLARAAYQALPREARAESCQDCASCEDLCPHGVAVRRKLRRADRLLA